MNDINVWNPETPTNLLILPTNFKATASAVPNLDVTVSDGVGLVAPGDIYKEIDGLVLTFDAVTSAQNRTDLIEIVKATGVISINQGIVISSPTPIASKAVTAGSIALYAVRLVGTDITGGTGTITQDNIYDLRGMHV